MKKERLRKLIVIVLAIVFTVFPQVNLREEDTAYAGTQIFYLPDETIQTPINLLTGSFETPTRDLEGWYVPQSNVPGWLVKPINPDNWNLLYSNYLQYMRYSPYKDDYPNTMADGAQFIELTAEYQSRYFQTINTVPGDRILWSFAHMARPSGANAAGDQEDIMNFYMRVPGNETNAPTGSEIIVTAIDNALDEWQWYYGDYIVPAGQTRTNIGFHPVYWATQMETAGNLTDDVKVQTPSNLISKQSIETSFADNDMAYKGETVEITVQIVNWGETEASRSVFTEVMNDGLTYVQGSATINGFPAGDLATYDSVSEELRINIGSGATVGTSSINGGLINGSMALGTSGNTGRGATVVVTFQAKVTGDAGDLVKQQASVTYNDNEFEHLIPDGYTDYSSVTGETPVASDETTYVNQFVILDRTISGRAWYDSDEDGMIDTGELMASGVTVGIYSSATKTYTTPITGVGGDALLTTTDASGNYYFSEVPSGTYKVVAATPSGYFVTLKTVSTDNDATAENSNAVTDAISMTEVLSGSNTLQDVENIDFGFAALMSIEKDAQVNGGAIDNGSVTSPVNVEQGDIITYTIIVDEESAVTGANITDILPEGLILITTPGTYTAGMTWSTTGSITTVTWLNQSLAAGISTFQFQALVDALAVSGTGMTYVNEAGIASGASNYTSNSTYHYQDSADIYSLDISKIVKGTLADVNLDFEFTVGLSGVVGSLPYTGYSTVTGISAPLNGRIADGGTVYLSHGQGIIITNVPAGISYSVIETGVKGYASETSGSNATGTVNQNIQVEYVNTMNYVPPTGIETDIAAQLIVGIAALAGLIALAARARKRRKSHG